MPCALAQFLQSYRTRAANLRPRFNGTRSAQGRAMRLLFIGLTLLLAGGDGERDARARQAPAPHVGGTNGVVALHAPQKLISVESDSRDPLGEPIRVGCGSCHSNKAQAALPESMSELDEFHQGLRLEHGSLRCAHCHVVAAKEAPRLRLADGSTLPMTEAIQLCAQCHGPQWRDYQHGAHGGMMGHWDLTRGNRERNHCVDCHDPHQPKPPAVQPVEAARDRRPLGASPNHPESH